MTDPERTFCFIRDYIAMHGYGPTTADIAIGIKVAKQTAHQQLDLLEALGWIEALRGPKGYRLLRTMKITR